jgi:hypothetical protein
MNYPVDPVSIPAFIDPAVIPGVAADIRDDGVEQEQWVTSG